MTGRSRLCKVCGDWHNLARPWPHNCRPPAPPRAPLAAPQIAPRFGEFRTGMLPGSAIINDRREKRDFMERHDLVEFDEGVAPPREATELEWRQEFVADVKRAIETDPLNIPPVDVIGQSDTGGAPEIDPTEIEVFK